MRGATQSDLARWTGLTTSSISRLVKGITRPRPETCIKIADALSVPRYMALVAANYVGPDDINQAFDVELAGQMSRLDDLEHHEWEQVFSFAAYLRFRRRS